MLFNSIDFVIFLPIVFLLYWFVTNQNLRLQNSLIVIASYIFYGWWDWRFLSLIIFSTFIDYSIGIFLSKEDNQLKRKLFLWASIIVNIGFLGFFKYYNFFLDSFVSAFSFFSIKVNVNSLNIILPVGISFYTFQTLSYTIDVYQRKLDPTKDIIAFSAFVSFFPQLVAGPIERATNLLPQFYKKRIFDYSKAVDGMRQILWGLFKKIVIADNCAVYANQIFNNSADYGGSTLLLGAFFFTFQIYGDFSGYSDIAIGTSRFFGFNLKQNFAFPYFSRDIAEFWRRWHISLSTWFKDYIYIPLGGSRAGTLSKVSNTFIIFIISGFWHGANWTFVIWGLLNALYILPLIIYNKNRKYVGLIVEGNVIPSFKDATKIIFTFLLTVFAWIFFRAENINHAIEIIFEIFSMSFFQSPSTKGVLSSTNLVFLIIIIFMIIEWIGRENKFALEKVGLKWNKYIRWIFYFTITISIFLFTGSKQTFIYFQF